MCPLLNFCSFPTSHNNRIGEIKGRHTMFGASDLLQKTCAKNIIPCWPVGSEIFG